MSMHIFETILQNCKHISNQKFLTLHGLGEPLLDTFLPERIILAKNMGYKGIGFASNCTHLFEENAFLLMEAELDTIICSIDGACKQTHENIRIGTNYDEVVKNVLSFINIRNKHNYKTRVLVRFIRQESNNEEWDTYKKFWDTYLDKDKGDGVLLFDVHNWGETKKINRKKTQVPLNSPMCSDLLDRLFIHSTGKVALCCADDNGYFDLGNVLNDDPLKLFNSEHFMRLRQAMRDNKLLEIYPCSECTIIQSRETRILVD